MEEAQARSRVTTGQPPFFPSTSSERGDHPRESPEVISGIPPTRPPDPYPSGGGTLMKAESFLLVTTTSPVRVVVRPWEEGKLRRGGGGGGDLEGFSVRYRGTVSSSAGGQGTGGQGTRNPGVCAPHLTPGLG